MLKFDEDAYRGNAKATYDTRPCIEKAADAAADQGFSNIFFIAVGGSLAILWPLREMITQISAIPVFAENAAEIVHTGHGQLHRDSLVITASKSGDTKETVAAAKWCSEQGIRVVSLVGADDAPLAEYSRWVLPNRAQNGVEFQYMQLFLFVFRLLQHRGSFPAYERFADQLRHLPENLLTAKAQFEPEANRIAASRHNEPYSIWVGSGEMWGEVYLFSMCVLEEMQRVKGKAVSSSEFFHGTLELVDKDMPVFLVKGEGSRRVLDERVEAFCRQYTDKLTVIDTKQFAMPGIDDTFRWIIAPAVSSALLVDRLAVYYEKYTGYDLSRRRYYRRVDY